MQDVVVGANCNSKVGFEVLNLDGLVDGDHVFSFMAELNDMESTLQRTLFLPMTLTTSPT